MCKRPLTLWNWSVGIWPWHLANTPVGLFNTEHFSSANISAKIHIKTMKDVCKTIWRWSIFSCIWSICQISQRSKQTSVLLSKYNISLSMSCLFFKITYHLLDVQNSGSQTFYRYIYINHWYHCLCWCRCWVCSLHKCPHSKTEQKVVQSSQWSRCWWWSHLLCHYCCCHKDLKDRLTLITNPTGSCHREYKGKKKCFALESS